MSKKVPEKKSLFRRITAIFLIVLFIFITAAVLLALLLFDWRSPRADQVSSRDSLYIMQISGKIVRAIQNANAEKSQLCTINLAEEEINAALRMALQFYRAQEKYKDLHISARLQNGRCCTALTYTLCKGIYLKVQADMIPFFKDQKVKIQLVSCRVGAIPLPRQVLEKLINELIEEKLRKDKKVQKFLLLLHKAEITPEGGVLLQIPAQQAFRVMGLLF